MDLIEKYSCQFIAINMLYSLLNEKNGISEYFLYIGYYQKDKEIAESLLNDLIDKKLVTCKENDFIMNRTCYITFKGVWHLHELSKRKLKYRKYSKEV